MLNRIFKFSRISKLVDNNFASAQEVIAHMKLAQPAIRTGFIIGGVLLTLFPKSAFKYSLTKSFTNPFMALIKMHKKNNEVKIEAINNLDFDCSFDDSQLWDEVVIGSGPGGSVSALESCRSGNKVLIIEWGDKAHTGTKHHSARQLVESFASGGQEIILGARVIPFAQGKALGGGSEINSGLYHNVPKFVRDELLTLLNIGEEQWLEHESKVVSMLKIEAQSSESLGIYTDSPLLKMAEFLNWESKIVPRWRQYKDGIFFHNGMLATYLSAAIEKNLQVLVKHKVLSTKQIKDTVVTVIQGARCEHKVISKVVTISAGVTETPRILISSGYGTTRDFSFNFHAMSRLVAVFDFPVNDKSDIDPHQIWPSDFSNKIGAAVSTPELLSATKQNMSISSFAPIENTAVYYVSIVPDGNNGFVKLFGNLIPWYFFSDSTKKRIKKGVDLLEKALKASGAIEVFGNSKSPTVSTVHIFGSVPLGKTKILDSLGFVEGTSKKIRVSDGSLMPVAPVVNPQGPIMVLASYLAEKVHSTIWSNIRE